MSAKLDRVIKNLSSFVPSARNPHIEALRKAGLVDELSSSQITTIVRLMQQAYKNGESHMAAEKVDSDAVWVNGIGMIERQPDGTWLEVDYSLPNKGLEKDAS